LFRRLRVLGSMVAVMSSMARVTVVHGNSNLIPCTRIVVELNKIESESVTCNRSRAQGAKESLPREGDDGNNIQE